MKNTYVLCILLLCLAGIGPVTTLAHGVDKAKLFFEEGLLLQKAGKLEAATTKYLAAIQADVAFKEAYMALAGLKFDQEQFQAARMYRELATRYGAPADGFFIGECYFLEGKADSALQAYTIALQVSPEHEKAACRIAQVYGLRQQYDLSIQYYQTAIATGKSVGDASFAMAKIYFTMANFRNAAQAFEQSAKYGKAADADYYYHLGISYIQQNETEKGIECLESAHVLRTNDIQIMLSLADAYFKKQNFAKAIVQWNNILVLQPQNAFVMFMLGKSYICSGEVLKGQRICDQALIVGDVK
ncbi:tetratricopeptide repeat protein [Chitinophaga skermanii]|uniref:Tetratricopeptide repeat protein n=1 Tax=Chitinophaga skermanii TaxID=331697 RepID=A0A327QTI5_9BACT|nr:tetratricopeptide repeat protein [Chitinophaga skermanii]RAJ05067.1 tetratricopeptide repeat protein [Chitinophaga skermanii]